MQMFPLFYQQVTARRLWKKVYDELGGSPGSTSAATCTRRHYEKYERSSLSAFAKELACYKSKTSHFS